MWPIQTYNISKIITITCMICSLKCFHVWKPQCDAEMVTTPRVGITTHVVQKGMDISEGSHLSNNMQSWSFHPPSFLCSMFRSSLQIASIEKQFQRSCHQPSTTWTKPLAVPGTHEGSPAISLSLSLRSYFISFQPHFILQISSAGNSASLLIKKTENLRQELPWLLLTNLQAPTSRFPSPLPLQSKGSPLSSWLVPRDPI